MGARSDAARRYSGRVTTTFSADLHVHSKYSDTSAHAGIRALHSAESFSEPHDVYAAERARGMDFVTISDHNSLAGSLAIAHLPGTFLSTELDTWFPEDRVRVHVVALGLDEATFAEAMKARDNVYDLVACLREKRVVHYLAHPLFDMARRFTPDTVERMLVLFDVFEGRNGSRTARCNGLLHAIVTALTPEQMWAMAERQRIEPHGETPWRKALTGGSDDHSGLYAASAFTVAGGDGTAQGFLRAVAAGDCQPAGDHGDARLLAHSIYAAAFWRIREILRLDAASPRKRALGLLRKGFGHIGRDVPVLEKTVRGVRTLAPGLYRDGDLRGPSWEVLLEREIGSLLADSRGINAVDAKELNRRLFVVAQRLADDVTSLHLQPLLTPSARLGLKRRLQSCFAVGMVNFLEMPYYIAWAYQSRDRELQAQLRAYFLGERRRGLRERVAVLSDAAKGRSSAPGGGRGARQAQAPAEGTAEEEAPAPPATGHDPAAGASSPAARWGPDIDVALLTCPMEPCDGGAVEFRALAWRPARDGETPGLVVPPVVEILDYLDEHHVSALHTDSTGAQGLVAIVAAHLLHLPLTAAAGSHPLGAAPSGIDITQRLRRRYLRWFYEHVDEVYAATPAAAQKLTDGGIASARVSVLPAVATGA